MLNFKKTILLLILIVSIYSCKNTFVSKVITNQIGFQPEQFKEVIVVYNKNLTADTFEVLNEKNVCVFSGKLNNFGYDEDSGDYLAKGDFTEFKTSGNYKLQVKNYAISYPFKISNNINTGVIRLALRWLYLQRSGIDKNDSTTGIKLKADFTEPAILWDNKGIHNDKKIDIRGGWWDAGDYGRYVSPAATTLMSLFYAYRFNPDLFKDGFSNIPKSSNGIPDILDEAKWELDWLLKMQREDGAVHHKATTKNYSYVLPNEVSSPVYLFDVSTQATSQFAGVMAEASIVFKNIDKKFSDTLLTASKKAYQWLESNPEKYPIGGFKSPVDENGVESTGGPYSIEDEDETGLRFWASAGLFHATGEKKYQDSFKKFWNIRDKRQSVYTMSWGDGYSFGMFAYLDSQNEDKETKKQILEIVKEQSYAILNVIKSTGYSVALKGKKHPFGYDWGSNEYALEFATYLLLTNLHIPNADYVKAAGAQLNWILGVNPLNKCFMVGAGSNPLKTSHHAISMRLGRPFPGSIGEGPNSMSSGGDKALERLISKGIPNAKCYVDGYESYASNEPTIYGNAAFIAVAAWFAK